MSSFPPVSLENITTDVHELEKGMEAVRKEAEIRGKGAHSIVVRDFLANAEEKLRRLRNDAKAAQEAFRVCVEYFAESPRTTDANSFFSLLVRFVKAFKVSNCDLWRLPSINNNNLSKRSTLIRRTSKEGGWKSPPRMPTIRPTRTSPKRIKSTRRSSR